MKPDLDSIYSELDLQPNCSLEDFQRAYRRRIAELHPDRPGPTKHENQAALRDLIWAYAMVTRFHRRYGRMPGGYPPRMRRHAWPGSGQVADHSQASNDTDGSDVRRRNATLTLVFLFVALVVLLASWSWLTMGGSGAKRGAWPMHLPVIESIASGVRAAIWTRHLLVRPSEHPPGTSDETCASSGWHDRRRLGMT